MDFTSWYRKEWVPHMSVSGRIQGQIQLLIGAVSGLFAANLALIGLILGGVTV